MRLTRSCECWSSCAHPPAPACADFRASPRPLHQTSFRLAEASYAVAIFGDAMAPRTFLADVSSPKVQPVTHCNCDMTDLLSLLSQIFSKPRDSVQALVGWRLFRSAVMHLDTVSPTCTPPHALGSSHSACFSHQVSLHFVV